MTVFTILGAGGTIGRALAADLGQAGHTVHAITRAVMPALLASRRPVGHVINCIGLTGDFRIHPREAAEAHVAVTARCLGTLHCKSFLFLSSTRVYASGASTTESSTLRVQPDDSSELYNLTKLTGEALCLADPRAAVRVVRLSNVYGPGVDAACFLGQVLSEGRNTGHVLFRQAARSAKDYVSRQQVLRLLPLIATCGRSRLYNLASGHNTTHGQIAAMLRKSFGWRTAFAPDAPTVRFPPIDTTRLSAEFGPALSDLSTDLGTLLPFTQEAPCSPSMKQAIG